MLCGLEPIHLSGLLWLLHNKGIGFHSVKGRVCLLCLTPYVQHPEQCLTHGRFLISVTKKNEMGRRAVATPGNGFKQKEKSSSSGALDNHPGCLGDDETEDDYSQESQETLGLLQRNDACKMKDK